MRDEVEAEKQTTAVLEEKYGVTTEIRELQAEINEELEAKSARVSVLEWESADMKEQLAQQREDLHTSRKLVEARNGETEKTAELTDQMRRLHDRFGSTERQNQRTSSGRAAEPSS